MTLFLWSQTAATNNTIDSTVNWREGQAPSTVNNSARAMMAAIAKWRDDIAGTLTTAGTSTAYTIATSQGLTSLVNGTGLLIQFHTANGASPVINVDSLGSKALTTDGATAVPATALRSGGTYHITYRSAVDKWIVESYFGAAFNETSAPDLTAIEALSTTGILRRTGSNVWDLAASVTDLAATTANRLFGTSGAGASGLMTATAPLSIGSNSIGIGTASTAATGVVQLADAAAQEAQTSGRAVTSDIQLRHPSAIKAFVKWDNVTGGVLTNNQSLGVSSLTDQGSGILDVNFSTAFSAASYAAAGISRRSLSAGQGCEISNGTAVTTTLMRFNTTIYSGGFGTTTYGSAMFIGDLL